MISGMQMRNIAYVHIYGILFEVLWLWLSNTPAMTVVETLDFALISRTTSRARRTEGSYMWT